MESKEKSRWILSLIAVGVWINVISTLLIFLGIFGLL